MICQNCQHCKTVSYGNRRYTVSCLYNGEFSIHETNIYRFQCPSDSFEERKEEPKTEPPKDNLCVTLKCGRDITFYDEDFETKENFIYWCDHANISELHRFGNIAFRMSEVAAIGYIGD